MGNKSSLQSNAAVWTAVLFVGALVGTVYPVWRFYGGHRIWLGAPLFVALFVCAWFLGSGADREEIRKGLGPGLRTLVQTGPQWAGALVVLLLATQIGCGWIWIQRAIIPLAAGLLAGILRPRPVKKAEASPEAKKDEPPPMDFWKP